MSNRIRRIVSTFMGWALALYAFSGVTAAFGDGESSACPRTPADWTAWRTERLDRGSPYLASTWSEEDWATLDRCPAPSCMAPLKSYLERFKNFDSRLSGIGVDPEEYYGIGRTEQQAPQQRYLRFPEFLRADAAFMARATDPLATVPQIEAELERIRGARPSLRSSQVLRYDSRHLPTPPPSVATMGRLLIVLEFDGYDQWLQFGAVSPEQFRENGVRSNSISLVAVQKTRPKPNLFFNDWLWKSEGGAYSLTQRFERTSMENCYGCHKTGVIPIYPADGSLRDPGRDLPLIQRLNAKVSEYGAPLFGGFLDPDSDGPPLGPTDSRWERRRSAEFFERCAQKPVGEGKAPIPLLGAPGSPGSVASIRKLKQAMKCASCHDGENLGKLNGNLADASNAILRSFVVGMKKMPPQFASGPHALSDPEREALLRCLEDEYYEDSATGEPSVLRAWLQSVPCATREPAARRVKSGKPRVPEHS